MHNQVDMKDSKSSPFFKYSLFQGPKSKPQEQDRRNVMSPITRELHNSMKITKGRNQSKNKKR
jgi:hypothetical protein